MTAQGALAAQLDSLETGNAVGRSQRRLASDQRKLTRKRQYDGSVAEAARQWTEDATTGEVAAVDALSDASQARRIAAAMAFAEQLKQSARQNRDQFEARPETEWGLSMSLASSAVTISWRHLDVTALLVVPPEITAPETEPLENPEAPNWTALKEQITAQAEGLALGTSTVAAAAPPAEVNDPLPVPPPDANVFPPGTPPTAVQFSLSALPAAGVVSVFFANGAVRFYDVEVNAEQLQALALRTGDDRPVAVSGGGVYTEVGWSPGELAEGTGEMIAGGMHGYYVTGPKAVVNQSVKAVGGLATLGFYEAPDLLPQTSGTNWRRSRPVWEVKRHSQHSR